jgi:hypothetical protein
VRQGFPEQTHMFLYWAYPPAHGEFSSLLILQGKYYPMQTQFIENVIQYWYSKSLTFILNTLTKMPKLQEIGFNVINNHSL